MSNLLAVTNLNSNKVNAGLHYDCNNRVITSDYRNLVRAQ